MLSLNAVRRSSANKFWDGAANKTQALGFYDAKIRHKPVLLLASLKGIPFKNREYTMLTHFDACGREEAIFESAEYLGLTI